MIVVSKEAHLRNGYQTELPGVGCNRKTCAVVSRPTVARKAGENVEMLQIFSDNMNSTRHVILMKEEYMSLCCSVPRPMFVMNEQVFVIIQRVSGYFASLNTSYAELNMCLFEIRPVRSVF